MSFPELSLTAGVGDTAQLLVDLHDRDRGVLINRDSTKFGAPQVSHGPSGVVAGERDISVTVTVVPGRDGADVSRLIAQVGRALTRQCVYLRWRLSPSTPPVWLKVHPVESFGAMDYDLVFVESESAWRWQLDLTADAFAIGERLDLTPVTVFPISNPVVPTGPVAEIVDLIPGDAPTPLCMDLRVGNLTGFRTLLSSWAMEPSATRTPWMTLSGTTGDRGFRAVSPGRANGNDIEFDAKNTSLVKVATSSPQQPENQIPPGRYRAFVLIRRLPGPLGTCRVALRSDFFGQSWGTRAQLFDPQGWNITETYLDLGTLTFPAGIDPTGLGDDDAFPGTFSIHMAGDGGGAVFAVRMAMLLPIEASNTIGSSRALAALWGSSGYGRFRFDGEAQRVGVITEDDRWQSAGSPLPEGSFPLLHPGARNFVQFIPRTNADASGRWGDVETGAQSAKMWCHPRYLHLGGVA